VTIPGYRNLYEFSRTRRHVKEALGARFWTLLNWTNWRVVLPVGGGHQEQVAGEIVAEVRAGRLAQLLVTNWPTPELNHTVVAYAYHATDAAIDFSVYDRTIPPHRRGLVRAGGAALLGDPGLRHPSGGSGRFACITRRGSDDRAAASGRPPPHGRRA